MADIVEYRRQRGQQRRDELLFSIMSQCDKANVTLVELTEYYTNKYDSRINSNSLDARRSSKRRSEVARNAVNTRWKKYFDFLKGSSTYAEKLQSLGADKKVSLPSNPVKAPTPPIEPIEQEVEEENDLGDFLSSFGGDD